MVSFFKRVKDVEDSVGPPDVGPVRTEDSKDLQRVLKTTFFVVTIGLFRPAKPELLMAREDLCTLVSVIRDKLC